MTTDQDTQAVMEEARLIAVEASRNGDMIRPEVLAKTVSQAYPNSGFDQARVAQIIKRAALLAGVAVVTGA